MSPDCKTKTLQIGRKPTVFTFEVKLRSAFAKANGKTKELKQEPQADKNLNLHLFLLLSQLGDSTEIRVFFFILEAII